MRWETCKLEAGTTAEFPMDLLASSVSNLDKHYYWDQTIQEVVEADKNADYLVVPVFGSIDHDAKSKMESLLDDSYKQQFVEVVIGNKIGLAVFGSYKNYPWNSAR